MKLALGVVLGPLADFAPLQAPPAVGGYVVFAVVLTFSEARIALILVVFLVVLLGFRLGLRLRFCFALVLGGRLYGNQFVFVGFNQFVVSHDQLSFAAL